MLHDPRVGERVHLNGHIGRVVNRWIDVDAARRRNDDGRRLALVLEDGSVLANVKAAKVHACV